MLKYFVLVSFVLLVHSATSSSANQINFNGKLSGLERLKDPKVVDCIVRCPVTRDFVPQCASDGKSYPNLSYVRCMNMCLIPFREGLTVKSEGYCESDQLFSD